MRMRLLRLHKSQWSGPTVFAPVATVLHPTEHAGLLLMLVRCIEFVDYAIPCLLPGVHAAVASSEAASGSAAVGSPGASLATAENLEGQDKVFL